MDIRRASSGEIAEYFLEKANCFSFNPKELARELEPFTDMADLDMYWLKCLSDGNYRTDMRNQLAADTGKILAKVPFIKEQIDRVSNHRMAVAAAIISGDHRTIQQSFSRLVFYHIYLTSDGDQKQQLTEAAGEDFYYLPMI